MPRIIAAQIPSPHKASSKPVNCRFLLSENLEDLQFLRVSPLLGPHLHHGPRRAKHPMTSPRAFEPHVQMVWLSKKLTDVTHFLRSYLK